jgi:DNA-binding CsgD family transcriptional regulator
VAAFLSLGEPGYQDLDARSIWEHALRTEPGPQPVVTEERLDACLSAVADFADLKSMWTLGHSRGVAGLAERAAGVAGLPMADQVQLRRAGLVHDIGRVAVPVNVWAKPGPLNRHEYEQVRLHAYHTERVLDAAAGLRSLARLAGSHGERCDGSGYHRGNKAAELPMTAWLLVAADCYHAMREPRPHRQALTAGAAADELGREAAAGRLAPDAVHAVLAAAGQAPPDRSADRADVPGPAGREPAGREPAGHPGAGRRPAAGQGAARQAAGQAGRRPAGLSERECEVLGLLARGLATKQVARRLGISPKTCDHHIQRLYRKTGLSTRAGATLFALEHGLIGGAG